MSSGMVCVCCPFLPCGRYDGGGIYRHVWLTALEPKAHLAQCVTCILIDTEILIAFVRCSLQS